MSKNITFSSHLNTVYYLKYSILCSFMTDNLTLHRHVWMLWLRWSRLRRGSCRWWFMTFAWTSLPLLRLRFTSLIFWRFMCVWSTRLVTPSPKKIIIILINSYVKIYFFKNFTKTNLVRNSIHVHFIIVYKMIFKSEVKFRWHIHFRWRLASQSKRMFGFWMATRSLSCPDISLSWTWSWGPRPPLYPCSE